MRHVETCMGGHPVIKKLLKEFVMNFGYSERAYDRAMAQAKLPTRKYGNEWAFLPSEAMLQRHEQQKQRENEYAQTPTNMPRAHGTAVVEPTPRKAG